MLGIDQKIVLFFQSIRCDGLTNIFSAFIALEFWNVAAFVFVFLTLYRTGTLRVPVVSFVIAQTLSNFCYRAIKIYVHRPRPFLTIKGSLPLITPHGFSFPSGHATLAMAMAVVLGFHFPKARRIVYTLAVLIGLSRVYFGAHYLSDVLAGFVLGAAVGHLSILLERGILSVNKGVDLRERSKQSDK